MEWCVDDVGFGVVFLVVGVGVCFFVFVGEGPFGFGVQPFVVLGVDGLGLVECCEDLWVGVWFVWVFEVVYVDVDGGLWEWFECGGEVGWVEGVVVCWEVVVDLVCVGLILEFFDEVR